MKLNLKKNHLKMHNAHTYENFLERNNFLVVTEVASKEWGLGGPQLSLPELRCQEELDVQTFIGNND